MSRIILATFIFTLFKIYGRFYLGSYKQWKITYKSIKDIGGTANTQGTK